MSRMNQLLCLNLITRLLFVTSLLVPNVGGVQVFQLDTGRASLEVSSQEQEVREISVSHPIIKL